jgi:hypothetical protein
MRNQFLTIRQSFAESSGLDSDKGYDSDETPSDVPALDEEGEHYDNIEEVNDEEGPQDVAASSTLDTDAASLISENVREAPAGNPNEGQSSESVSVMTHHIIPS